MLDKLNDKLNEAALRAAEKVFGPKDSRDDEKAVAANIGGLSDPFIFLPIGGAVVLAGIVFGFRVMSWKDKKEPEPHESN